MKPTLNQNPENVIDPNSNTTAIRKNYRVINKKNLFQQCRNVLKKPYESRYPIDNEILQKLIEQSQFLTEATELVSYDFVKGILRNAKIEMIEERQLIVEAETPISNMLIVLEGKLGVEKNIQQQFIQNIQGNGKMATIQPINLNNSEMFQKLTVIAKKQRDQLRKSHKFQRSGSLPISGDYQLLPPILSEQDFAQMNQNIQRLVQVNEQFGGKQRIRGKTFPSRTVALQKSTILIIQINFLFYWLEAAFKVKLHANIEHMKLIPAFENLQQQKLSEIILSMKLIKKKRQEYIYRQGDIAQNLFVLIDGNLKMSKEARLFEQNPNDLYVDRRRLMQQINKDQKTSPSKMLKKKDQGILHFANLTSLYNYRPVKKNIELGVISSFGLFGEEELIYKTPREITIQVNSIEASFFQIDYKRILQIVGVKLIDRFKQNLEKSISKKVLYRQSQFADHIDFQNRTNMDYFYLDDNKSKTTPRKFKLQKINDKITPKTARDLVNHAPAFYTTSNFNKMLSKRYEISTKKQKQQFKNTNQNSSENIIDTTVFNEAEQRLVNISHSWNPIQKKVKQQKMMSQKISPLKHQINIESPLIEQQFFRDVAKEQRRINKQFRTIRLSLGKKTK